MVTTQVSIVLEVSHRLSVALVSYGWVASEFMMSITTSKEFVLKLYKYRSVSSFLACLKDSLLKKIIFNILWIAYLTV